MRWIEPINGKKTGLKSITRKGNSYHKWTVRSELNITSVQCTHYGATKGATSRHIKQIKSCLRHK